VNELVYQLRQVTKEYDGQCVLSVDELDLFKAEFFALVGPSGVGKSTLLRLLNFLEPPTSGAVRFFGTDLGSATVVPLSLRRRVTTVFQRSILLNRSVAANVAFGLQLRGKKDVGSVISEALSKVGLASLSRRQARTLSGGELQRVALARAMVLEPDVLLLDEPTANLDPYNVGMIEDIVRGINRDLGSTILMVTHNVFQARRLAQRVGFLLDGQLVEVADVHQFFEEPRDPRTLAFVRGEMVY